MSTPQGQELQGIQAAKLSDPSTGSWLYQKPSGSVSRRLSARLEPQYNRACAAQDMQVQQHGCTGGPHTAQSGVHHLGCLPLLLPDHKTVKSTLPISSQAPAKCTYTPCMCLFMLLTPPHTPQHATSLVVLQQHALLVWCGAAALAQEKRPQPLSVTPADDQPR